jgi:HSP90 family molecular chaperone
VANRVLSELDKLAQNGTDAHTKVRKSFGLVLKEGL